jgi:tRNA(adenine34) deaminase
MKNKEEQNHEFYMRKCIALAHAAKHRGDSAVGSVIVKNEAIIAEGVEGGKTNNDITYHAEVEAIRQATNLLHTQDLSGCIMYSTHEPCIMCSYIIRHTGISTVVIGVTTGEIGGFSSHLPLLLDNSIKRWRAVPKIISGILEKECAEL